MTSFDCNCNINPLAFGIGDIENDDCLEWFFKQLHEMIGDVSNLVIICDQNASIANIVNKVFRDAQHGLCMYHLKGNMKAKFWLRRTTNFSSTTTSLQKRLPVSSSTYTS